MIHQSLNFNSQPWSVLTSKFTPLLMEHVYCGSIVNTFLHFPHILFGSSSASILDEFSV
jgi:hypothetical protein